MLDEVPAPRCPRARSGPALVEAIWITPCEKRPERQGSDVGVADVGADRAVGDAAVRAQRRSPRARGARRPCRRPRWAARPSVLRAPGSARRRRNSAAVRAQRRSTRARSPRPRRCLAACPTRAASNRAPQRLERALDEREVQVGLVTEIDVDQRAAQPRPSRDLVHGDGIPADLGIQRLGGVDDLAAAAVAFLLAAFGDVRHGRILDRSH